MVHLIDAMKYVDPACPGLLHERPGHAGDRGGDRRKVAAEPRVTWINTLLREEQYIELYSQSTVFCCRRSTSRSHHQPRAMACERPVVASAVAASRSRGAEVTGLLVRPASRRRWRRRSTACCAIAAWRRAWARRPQARRGALLLDLIAKKTLDMYEDLVKEAKARKSAGKPAPPDPTRRLSPEPEPIRLSSPVAARRRR